MADQLNLTVLKLTERSNGTRESNPLVVAYIFELVD